MTLSGASVYNAIHPYVCMYVCMYISIYMLYMYAVTRSNIDTHPLRQSCVDGRQQLKLGGADTGTLPHTLVPQRLHPEWECHIRSKAKQRVRVGGAWVDGDGAGHWSSSRGGGIPEVGQRLNDARPCLWWW